MDNRYQVRVLQPKGDKFADHIAQFLSVAAGKGVAVAIRRLSSRKHAGHELAYIDLYQVTQKGRRP